MKTALFQKVLLKERQAATPSIMRFVAPKTLSDLEAIRNAPSEKSKSEPTVSPTVFQSTFPQLVDHFLDEKLGEKAGTKSGEKSDLTGKSFKQRFWIDSKFAVGENAPVLYEICGESTCSGTSGSGPIFDQAKRLNAHLVSLEHRYYGTSQPFADLSSNHLVYLSTRQAVEDLASFQRYAQANLNLKGKWIAIGGSYAGSLSAFYRLKHPELVVGSLASSAPVKAKADFKEYDRHVAKVAGPECLGKIQAVVAETEKRLALGGASAIAVKKIFLAEEVRDDRDFLYVLADMASIAIQYGHQAEFCNGLTSATDLDSLLAKYSEVGTAMLKWFGITAVQDSFQGAESLDPNDYVSTFGARAWLYQSCTEYGYYQIADGNPAASARSARITLSYHDEVCDRLFGLKNPVDIKATNAFFYETLFSPEVSNIFFTNGGNDPWSNLSILSGSADSLRNTALSLLTLPGFAHCDDLGRDIPAAKTQFTSEIQAWLN